MLTPDLAQIFPGTPKAIPVIPIVYKRTIDEKLVTSLAAGYRDYLASVRALGVEKLIVGLSGGVDSAVACAFLHHAEIPARAIIIEADHEDALASETQFAVTIAEKIGMSYEVVHVADIYERRLRLFGETSRLPRVHLRSRLISDVILQFADHHAGFVVATTDKSEDILKIYEESFRGHFWPVIDFYKSEMYDIADSFGLTEMRSRRSGCPELIDIDAFGVPWEQLDPLLYLLAERHESVESIAANYGVDEEWLRKLARRIALQPLRTEPKYLRFPR